MMSRKRSVSPSFTDHLPKKLAISKDEVEARIKYLCSLVPLEKFQNRILPIVWKHQLYPLGQNRTLVDRSVNTLCEEGKIRQFKLGTTVSDHETAIAFLDEYRSFVFKFNLSGLTEKFLTMVQDCPQMIFSKEDLQRHSINEKDACELVRKGLLAVHRSVGQWLLSIPNCGQYMKAFNSGRKRVLSLIKKTKFNEIQESEILNKKPGKECLLPWKYHILELIGSDSVQCVDSPSGKILRI